MFCKIIAILSAVPVLSASTPPTNCKPQSTAWDVVTGNCVCLYNQVFMVPDSDARNSGCELASQAPDLPSLDLTQCPKVHGDAKVSVTLIVGSHDKKYEETYFSWGSACLPSAGLSCASGYDATFDAFQNGNCLCPSNYPYLFHSTTPDSTGCSAFMPQCSAGFSNSTIDGHVKCSGDGFEWYYRGNSTEAAGPARSTGSSGTSLVTMSLLQVSSLRKGDPCTSASSGIDFSNGYCTCEPSQIFTPGANPCVAVAALPPKCPAPASGDSSHYASVVIGCTVTVESVATTYYYRTNMVA